MGSLPEKLRSLMADTRHSQQQLADKLGCSQTLVYKWLKGDAAPDYRQVKALADALGCDCDYLCDDSMDIVEGDELARRKLVKEALELLTSREVLMRLVGAKSGKPKL